MNGIAVIYIIEITRGCRATGIYFEETLDLAESEIEILPKKSGERLVGCHVQSTQSPDSTTEQRDISRSLSILSTFVFPNHVAAKHLSVRFRNLIIVAPLGSEAHLRAEP
jgi:hypothetical protein